MKWFRSFYKQVGECRRTGNRFILHSPNNKLGVVVCVHFKTYCHSKACFEMRKQKGKRLIMPAYNFKKQFVPLIESGEKHQTIRALRKDGRKPRVGEPLYLYTGMRTKACRKLKEVVCKSVEQITIEECFTIVLNAAAPLTMNQMIKMSKADGFETLYDFMDFFRKTHGLPFRGIIISW